MKKNREFKLGQFEVKSFVTTLEAKAVKVGKGGVKSGYGDSHVYSEPLGDWSGPCGSCPDTGYTVM